ncbi:hypothetical protein EV361DRAFT_902024 [Lentinula raphanica]|nr:hypothetical protein EV361DRAFT_902024 [Lentinula raphanica]
MTAWNSEFASATPEEQDIVSTLLTIIGGTQDQADSVLSVYRRNGRNADKAAELMLTSSDWLQNNESSSMSRALVPLSKPPGARPNTPDMPNLIDLTKDDAMTVDPDEDLRKALQLSMEGIQVEGIPDQNNDEVVMNNGEEQVEDFDVLIRKDGRPISLRSPTPETSYAALLLQALFHVPQVRSRLAEVPFPEGSNPEDSDLSPIIELFANLDLANLARLDCDGVCKALNVWSAATNEFPNATRDLYEYLAGLIEPAVTSESGTPLFTFTSAQVNIDPGEDEPKMGVMSNHTYVTLESSLPSSAAPGESLENDLLTRLARDLSKPILDLEGGPNGWNNTVISTPSDVVAFILTSTDPSNPVSFAVPSHNASSLSPRFSYPSSLYIDPFLHSKFSLVHFKRVEKERIMIELKNYEEVRERLIGKGFTSTSTSVSASAAQSHHTDSGDQGVLPSIRSALYYYEHVANRSEGEDGTESGAEERKRAVEEVEKSLRATLEGIEKTLKDLDAKISDAKTRLTAPSEEKELKEHKYDLRAVLMRPAFSNPQQAADASKARSGLNRERGRDTPFVYVRDIRDDFDKSIEPEKKQTRWWKSPASASTKDYVEEVPEEVVLSMASSLSASTQSVPYMLIYSKSLSTATSHGSSATTSTSEQWPQSVVASVELNNSKFLEMVETWRATKEQIGLMEQQSDPLIRDVSMIDITKRI